MKQNVARVATIEASFNKQFDNARFQQGSHRMPFGLVGEDQAYRISDRALDVATGRKCALFVPGPELLHADDVEDVLAEIDTIAAIAGVGSSTVCKQVS